MMNWAPLRYRKIQSKFGGPIQTINITRKEITANNPGYMALAYLKDGLVKKSPIPYALYSDASGGGAANYKILAAYKAISEALERWAFVETSSNGFGKNISLDIEPASTGFAAYPEYTPRKVRIIAANEALERWAIVLWWFGRLSAHELVYKPQCDFNALEIITPLAKKNVVIVWRYISETNQYAYGFACHDNLKEALTKAEIEQQSNERVLKCLDKEPNQIKKIARVNEKRLVHFSLPETFQHFHSVVAASYKRKSDFFDLPRIICDREIKGPWTQYARVWRTLYFHPFQEEINSNDLNVFIF